MPRRVRVAAERDGADMNKHLEGSWKPRPKTKSGGWEPDYRAINIRLDIEVWDRLNACTFILEQTRPSLVRQLIIEGVERIEERIEATLGEESNA